MRIQLILSLFISSVIADKYLSEGGSASESSSNSAGELDESTFFIPDEQLEQKAPPPVYQNVQNEPIEYVKADGQEARPVDPAPLPEPVDEDGLTKEQAAERQQFLANVGQAYLEALMEYEYQEAASKTAEEEKSQQDSNNHHDAPYYQHNEIYYVQNNQQTNVAADVDVIAPQKTDANFVALVPDEQQKSGAQEPSQLAVDPPRQHPDGMLAKDEPVEVISPDVEPPRVAAAPASPSLHEPSVMTPPSFMAVVVDLTDVLIVLIGACILLWILNKAYRYFMYPREVAKTQKVLATAASALATVEAGSVHKVPLP